MRSSAIVLAGLSALALAAPVQKRACVTDVVIDYVTVFVTEGLATTKTRSSVVPPATSTPPIVTPTIAAHVAPVVTHGVFVESTTPEPIPIPAPTPQPIFETPTPEPIVETPTPEPIVETPTPEPIVETPTPQPAAVVDTTPAVTTPAQAAPPAGSDYKSAVLFHHNVHRTNHSAPALTYDDTLAGYAADVARTCVFKHDIRKGGGGYGQNIAKSGSTGNEKARDPAAISGVAISNQWYNSELPLFDPSMYGRNVPDMSNFSGWGHFSQIIWKSTASVGCATQFCEKGSAMFSPAFSGWYTVCNYGSPGNVDGQYAANVLKPLGQSAVVAN
ncbi:hypothetical protein VC83_04955 [Pseudogymnoascus destructans]|uniref:SCP domain-containing protein n=2 Tax=Pseudogymnoascus destructans TaxID=655981 RepID=L8FMV0_PSED2|nr:uncharacterized protein VC83_04955 [Pseudogymnoascus destructans]ELR01803.1 hypothetical protein GMDG_00903 [Pseudogymnoascus destructans 20631-21]OAF58727.1 hypothetical protein VC83_04955 [Pseudogymnoascus destructans]